MEQPMKDESVNYVEVWLSNEDPIQRKQDGLHFQMTILSSIHIPMNISRICLERRKDPMERMFMSLMRLFMMYDLSMQMGKFIPYLEWTFLGRINRWYHRLLELGLVDLRINLRKLWIIIKRNIRKIQPS